MSGIKQQVAALEEAERLEREALMHRERAVAHGLYQRLLHGCFDYVRY